MDLTNVLPLLLSLGVGAFIGLEREYHKDEFTGKKSPYSSLGVRTFSLLSLMGGLAGVLFIAFQPIAMLLTGAAMLLIVGNYIMGTLHTKDSGITTELASMFSFFMGFIITQAILPLQVTIALVVVATLILSRKTAIKNAVAGLHAFETNAFINYAIIALVILPFLPNRPILLGNIPFIQTLAKAYQFSLGDFASVELVNLYKLWFTVSLITGIDMLGYFLNKFVGAGRGYVVSAITGGFVSSTATTIALAQESKHTHTPTRLVGAAILANTASFIQILLLLAPTSTALLTASMTPMAAMILAGTIVGLFFLRSRQSASKKAAIKKEETSVFSLSSALKFASIYVLVRFGSGIGLTILGNSGIYLTSGIAALAGLDAVTLNLADLTARLVIPVESGVLALLIANAVNLLAKVGYSYAQGSRAFTMQFGLGMILLIVASFLAASV